MAETENEQASTETPAKSEAKSAQKAVAKKATAKKATTKNPTNSTSAKPEATDTDTAKPSAARSTSSANKSASVDRIETRVSAITATQANRHILLAVGAGVSIVLVARVAGTPGVSRLNDPGDLLKIGIGTGATVVALMLIAEVAPEVATGLAWLIFVGAALTYGVDFATALRKGTLNPGIPLTGIGDVGKGAKRADIVDV